MNLRFWLNQPHLVAARVRYWIWEKQNPDKPWLTPGAVAFCNLHLTKTMKGWEFGSGRSTAWFAKRLAGLVSIEHSPEWFSKVRLDLQRGNFTNVDYRLIPLDHPEPEPERSDYRPPPGYVRALADEPDASLDFIVVDGHYRSTCIRTALAKLRGGGLLLVDDCNLWSDRIQLPVPIEWPLVHESTNGLKITSVWSKPGGVPANHPLP